MIIIGCLRRAAKLAALEIAYRNDLFTSHLCKKLLPYFFI